MVDNRSLNNQNSSQDSLTDKEVLKGVSEQSDSKDPAQKNISPKMLLGAMTILVVISLVFAVGNWFDALKLGFTIPGDVSNEFAGNSQQLNNELADVFALQEKDTDLDGLSDYDELYVYNTSPYIADSDSDGFSDFEEINNNENPNCPAGQNCQIVTSASLAPSFFEDLSALTTEEIRQLLMEVGMSEDDLAGIDDSTLRALYTETLQDMEVEGASFSEMAEVAEQDYQAITPTQLRAILLQQPDADVQAINSLTDEELTQIWEEILQLEGIE